MPTTILFEKMVKKYIGLQKLIPRIHSDSDWEFYRGNFYFTRNLNFFDKMELQEFYVLKIAFSHFYIPNF